MPDQITLSITKGATEGKSFVFQEKDRVFIGRQEDCGIVIPENTVSRYHCVLEITPPEIRLQDFGSLNGTFLNGELIGRRERGQPAGENTSAASTEYPLRDGDVLGLGKRCELKVSIHLAEHCADCGVEMPDTPPMYHDPDGKPICLDCHARREEERRKKEEDERRKKQAEEKHRRDQEAAKRQEEAEKRQAAEQPKCAGCGKPFIPKSPDNKLCDNCLADQGKVMDAILRQLMGGMGVQKAGTSPALLEGFDKISLLGKGGMGEVWKVQERKTGKYYALKTMLPAVAADERSKKLFLREAGISRCLDHPNVVRAYQSGCVNDTFYILMDLCEGGSADELIAKKGGKLPLVLATYITLQVLSGLDYVHNLDVGVEIKKGMFGGTKEVDAKGVVHRDFKPGNIFLSDKSDTPVAMVADFGMAKAFDAAGLSRVTKTGSVMGTPVFMPRMQALNCKYAKPEVDVWAAAASYYYMLTGTFPKNFRNGSNPWKVIVTEAATPIRKRDESIPAKLAAVIDKALIETPQIGYKSAIALKKDIFAALPSDVQRKVKGVMP